MQGRFFFFSSLLVALMPAEIVHRLSESARRATVSFSPPKCQITSIKRHMFVCTGPARLPHLCRVSCDAPRMESEERRSLWSRMLCFGPIKNRFQDVSIGENCGFGVPKPRG